MTLHLDVLAALSVFAFVAGWTPGPNNMMLMASGVNFGLVRSLPHLAGVALGFAFMTVAIGFGLDHIFRVYPSLLPLLRYVGAVYLLWLAVKIASSGPIKDGGAVGQPLGFLAAAAFQWVNPKGWIMAMSALTSYAVSDDPVVSVVIVAGVFTIVGVPGGGAWAAFGSAMRRALSDPKIARRFNFAMAALLAASIAPIFWE